LAKANTVENKDSTKLTSSISESIALWFDCSVCSLRCTTSERYWIPF
jgi:hypothetical protein